MNSWHVDVPVQRAWHGKTSSKRELEHYGNRLRVEFAKNSSCRRGQCDELLCSSSKASRDLLQKPSTTSTT